MRPIEGKVITVKLPVPILDEIQRIADKRRTTKAEVYRMLLSTGIQAHRDLEAVGRYQEVNFPYFVCSALREQIGLVGEQMRLPM